MKHVEADHTNEHFAAIQLLLPKNRMLMANHTARTLFFVSTDAGPPAPMIIAHQQFTLHEWHVLLALLRAYPSAVPRDTLLAAFHTISPAWSHQQMQMAHRDGHLRETLRPLRDTISRLRPKVQAFSLDIAARHGKGYVIIVLTPAPLPGAM